MSDYGFEGPVIENITGFRDIYGGMLWLSFDTDEAQEAAWDQLDPLRLAPEYFWAPDYRMLVLVKEEGMICAVLPGVGHVWFGEHYITEI